MKKIYLILVLITTFSFIALTSTGQTTKLSTKEQKAIFDKFFALNDGNEQEFNQKLVLLDQLLGKIGDSPIDTLSRYKKYLLAWSGMISEQYDETIPFIENSIIAKYPDFAEGYYLYGQILIEIGYEEAGTEQLQKCMELNPKLYQPSFYLATYFESVQNYQLSLVYYNILEKTNNTHKSLYYNRANLYAALENWTAAITDFTKTLETQPTHFRALFNRGRCYLAMEDYPKAEDDFNQYVLKYTDDLDGALYYRGAARYYQSKMESACADMKAAAEQGHESASEFISAYCN